MSRKTILFLICLTLAAAPVLATEILYFTDPGFEDLGGKQEANTLFSHDLHAETYKVKCKSCHHVYEDGENVWEEGDPVQLCSDCHGESKAELVNAYHMNCWGCHKRITQAYPESDTPTTKCQKCHVPEDQLEAEKERIQEKTEKQDSKLMRVIEDLKAEGFY
ncbi:MAG: cytochrome c3 family protein [Desulfonatronovibrionaceae bacterium]